VPLTFETRGAVGLLTLDAPERGNALRPEDMSALAAQLDAAAEQVRALVLTGAGDRVFCSGYDLARIGDVPTSGGRSWDERFPELVQAVTAHRRFPWPMIAALNGHAIGGGALLASLCDLRVARPGVRFHVPASRIGVMYPLPGFKRLLRLVGPGRAAEILLQAAPVDAERALSWGLYNEVVADPLSRALALAEDLAGHAPLAVQGMKAVLLRLEDGADEGAVHALHAAWAARCVGSSDLVEGIAAARERRPPRFEGR
jgi:enoyl-CoA hydratase/carnithine racemase